MELISGAAGSSIFGTIDFDCQAVKNDVASFDGKILCFCQGVNCAGSRSFSLSYALKLISSPAGF